MDRDVAGVPAGRASRTVRSPASLGYREWMTAAAEEYERLLRLLRGLDGGQWRAPTDCAGWEVRDVVAHLAGAAAATASPRELVRQALHARRLGRHGDLVDRMNEIQIRERRALTPAELVDDLAAAAPRGLRARRRVPAPVLALPLPFGPPLGTRPLGYLMGRIYTRDAWMHRIDLARATGAPLELTAERDGAVVEDVVAEWAAVHGAGYELRLTGPAGGLWSRGTAGCGGSAGPAGPGHPAGPAGLGHPAGALEVDAIEFARALSGRVTGEGLLSHRVPF